MLYGNNFYISHFYLLIIAITCNPVIIDNKKWYNHSHTAGLGLKTNKISKI